MALRTLGIATIAFTLSALTYAAEGQNTDPRSVLKRSIEAHNTGELDAALALWTDDDVIINTRGRKVAGKENLRKFIQTNISRKIKQEPEAIQTVGDKVTWINRESNESYSISTSHRCNRIPKSLSKVARLFRRSTTFHPARSPGSNRLAQHCRHRVFSLTTSRAVSSSSRPRHRRQASSAATSEKR